MTRKIQIWTLDQDSEPTDEQKMIGTTNGSDNRIEWRKDMPNPNADPRGFAEWLRDYHQKHNGE